MLQYLCQLHTTRRDRVQDCPQRVGRTQQHDHVVFVLRDRRTLRTGVEQQPPVRQCPLADLLELDRVPFRRTGFRRHDQPVLDVDVQKHVDGPRLRRDLDMKLLRGACHRGQTDRETERQKERAREGLGISKPENLTRRNGRFSAVFTPPALFWEPRCRDLRSERRVGPSKKSEVQTRRRTQ